MKRVVFFEDEDGFYQNLIQWLREGSELFVCLSTDVLLEELRSSRQIDLLLLDLMATRGSVRDSKGREAPEIDTGILVIEKIRAGEFGKHRRATRVIVFSARADTAAQARCKVAGVLYYHVKGRPLAPLLAAISKALV